MVCSHTPPPRAPSIETATDPVHSPEELRLRWLALMSPLGFGDRTLWMAFLGPDRRMQKMLRPFPAQSNSDRERVSAMIAELGSAFATDFPRGTTAAFLLSRPGVGPVTEDDVHWAGMVIGAADRVSLPLEPFFRANDVSLVRVRPSS